QAMAVIERVCAPNLKLQLDLYHCQITEGDLVHHIRDLAGRFAHVQIAGNPDRNEPDQGEVNYGYVLDVLDASGYAGWVGCEYRPKAGTREGLAWAQPYGINI
ncbi:MAG: TIM barrel protein, partial [Vulcanimicrobiaceae bacterium]